MGLPACENAGEEQDRVCLSDSQSHLSEPRSHRAPSVRELPTTSTAATFAKTEAAHEALSGFSSAAHGMSATTAHASDDRWQMTIDASVHFSVVSPELSLTSGTITAVCEGEVNGNIHEVATSDGERFLVIFTDLALLGTLVEIVRQISQYSLTFWLQVQPGRMRNTADQEWSRPPGMDDPLSNWRFVYQPSLKQALEDPCVSCEIRVSPSCEIAGAISERLGRGSLSALEFEIRIHDTTLLSRD